MTSKDDYSVRTRARICSYYTIIVDLCSKIGLYLQPGIDQPALPAEVRDGLVALSDGFHQSSHLMASWSTRHPLVSTTSFLGQCERVIRALAAHEGTGRLDPQRPRYEADSAYHVLWWDCNLRVGRDGVKDPAVGCEAVDQMMACSRVCSLYSSLSIAWLHPD